MSAARTGEGRTGFRLRRLDKPEDLRAAEELQRAAMGMDGETPVAAAVQRDYLDHGGQVLGAFADIYLAGATIGFLGWDGERLFHCTHGVWVRPEYRHHHVGFQLMAFLRDEVLRQGLPLVRGTFDPLQSEPAHLLLRKLGARPERYRPHLYGALDSEADRGLETDRIEFRWELAEARTETRLAGRAPTAQELGARGRESAALLESELGDAGLRRPTAVAETDRPQAQLEIPFDLGAIRQHAPELLRSWRHAVRDAFRLALDSGYVVDDFAVLSIEHERRSFYLLRAAPPPAAGAERGPPVPSSAADVAPERAPEPPHK